MLPVSLKHRLLAEPKIGSCVFRESMYFIKTEYHGTDPYLTEIVVLGEGGTFVWGEHSLGTTAKVCKKAAKLLAYPKVQS